MTDTRARQAAAGPDVVARLRNPSKGSPRWATTMEEAAAAIEAQAAEIARLEAEVASLRLTLGGRTFSATAPKPFGCPAPGMCVQVAEIARLRTVLQRIATRALLGINSAAVARAALAPPPASDGGEA